MTDINKYFNVLLSIRVMAKFLGFLDFLPFSKPSRAANVGVRVSGACHSTCVVMCLHIVGEQLYCTGNTLSIMIILSLCNDSLMRYFICVYFVCSMCQWSWWNVWMRQGVQVICVWQFHGWWSI